MPSLLNRHAPAYLVLIATLITPVVLYAADASWSEYISGLVEHTDSLPMRIMLVTVLGMLLSLTPCIYPMIPITVGILQAQGSNSLLRNFLLAAAYTVGIASTFALLGLSAAYTGQLFGSLMTKPIVIIPMVGLLLYLAGAMMGFYEMYTPTFLQTSSRAGGGSLTSAFLFGAASGTVASPCLSPGLILLLSIVTTLGNAFLGFILLFAFGIGLSIPLLIIGTCSSTLNSLPRAGIWMVEIKKLFGLIMIGMCLYFLQPLLTDTQLSLLLRTTMLTLALYYLYIARQTTASSWKTTKYALASLLACAALGGGSLQHFIYAAKNPQATIQWQTDYAAAKTYALQEQKYIFVDVTADYCSICKAIEKKFFYDATVIQEAEGLVSVKINAEASDNEAHTQLLQAHGVLGTPTFLIIDPKTEHEIARFGPEVYDLSSEGFIALLQPYVR